MLPAATDIMHLPQIARIGDKTKQGKVSTTMKTVNSVRGDGIQNLRGIFCLLSSSSTFKLEVVKFSCLAVFFPCA